MSSIEKKDVLDPDWVVLIKEAKEIGMSTQEVRLFFHQEIEQNQPKREE